MKFNEETRNDLRLWLDKHVGQGDLLRYNNVWGEPVEAYIGFGDPFVAPQARNRCVNHEPLLVEIWRGPKSFITEEMGSSISYIHPCFKKEATWRRDAARKNVAKKKFSEWYEELRKTAPVGWMFKVEDAFLAGYEASLEDEGESHED